MRILYVGDLRPGWTTLQRMQTMIALQHDVAGIDTSPTRLPWPQLMCLRAKRKITGRHRSRATNQAIIEHCRQNTYDVLWLDKCLNVTAETIKQVAALQPECLVIGYAPDDMMNPANQSPEFLSHLPLYDTFFTTKTYNVAELEELGCRRAVFIGNGYDPNTHRPMPLTDQQREDLGGRVGFIGSWEEPRARSMAYLATNGVAVRIWGNPRWLKVAAPPGMHIEGRNMYGDDYARAICAFDINLGFLRKQNRDLQTQRSIEVPACGAFMLAERTDEHQALFTEGKEAEFFSSDQELLDKVRYYLGHDDQRRQIAEAGRQRCIRSGYSNTERMRQMLQTVDGLASCPAGGRVA